MSLENAIGIVNFDGNNGYKDRVNGPRIIMNPSDPIKFAEWHVLAEGDSWFHFNRIGFQENLLQELEFSKTTVIVNMAMSGDNIAQMINHHTPGLFNSARVKAFKDAVAYVKWDFILISACGNDVIDAFDGGYDVGDKKVQIIKSCSNPTSFLDFIDNDSLDATIISIKQSFDILISLVRGIDNRLNLETKIIAHTYDYFTLRNISGSKSTRYKALKRNKVPATYWKQITGLMNDRICVALLSFNNSIKYPNVVVVDTLGTLDQADQDEPGNTRHWRNEIHPNRDGYNLIARKRVNKHLNP